MHHKIKYSTIKFYFKSAAIVDKFGIYSAINCCYIIILMQEHQKNPECHTIAISYDKLFSRVTCKVTLRLIRNNRVRMPRDVCRAKYLVLIN